MIKSSILSLKSFWQKFSKTPSTQLLENQSPLTFKIMQKNQQAPKGFHRLTIEERLDQIASMTELGQDEIQCLKKFGNLPEETANGMVENVIGVMGINMRNK